LGSDDQAHQADNADQYDSGDDYTDGDDRVRLHALQVARSIRAAPYAEERPEYGSEDTHEAHALVRFVGWLPK
jgi:hypothetical protein